MQPTMRIIVSMALLASAIASAYLKTDTKREQACFYRAYTGDMKVQLTLSLSKRGDQCSCLLCMRRGLYPDSSAKLRRDGVLNLYPFPRVGRASRNTWQVPLNDLYLEYEPSAEKRQLYAFPRVGRSDLSLPRAVSHEFQPMPVRRADTPGMWFGPRLGRPIKSDDDEITIQNDHSEPEQTEPIHEERRKRQTFN